MKIKQMIFVLAAIICAFVISGYHSLHEAQNKFNNVIHQSHSATQEIGLSFDWYGLTLVDTTVKYAHNIIDAEQALHDLKVGHANNKTLLESYFKTILPEEKKEAEYIRSQDEIVDKILVELYAAIKTGDKETINELLPQIYNVTDPLCDAINTVISIKTRQSLVEKNGIVDNIDQLKRFLFTSFALCLALCIGMAIPDNE